MGEAKGREPGPTIEREAWPSAPELTSRAQGERVVPFVVVMLERRELGRQGSLEGRFVARIVEPGRSFSGSGSTAIAAMAELAGAVDDWCPPWLPDEVELVDVHLEDLTDEAPRWPAWGARALDVHGALQLMIARWLDEQDGGR